MEISQILLGENDGFLRGGGQSGSAVAESVTPTPLTQLEVDSMALKRHIGESGFQSGLCIELTLPELLAIVPRKRRRTDAYSSLGQYLKQNYNITLNIVRNEKEYIYRRGCARI